MTSSNPAQQVIEELKQFEREQRERELNRLQEQHLDLIAEKRVLDEHLAAVQRELDRNRDRQLKLMDEQLEADRADIALDRQAPACTHCGQREGEHAPDDSCPVEGEGPGVFTSRSRFEARA